MTHTCEVSAHECSQQASVLSSVTANKPQHQAGMLGWEAMRMQIAELDLKAGLPSSESRCTTPPSFLSSSPSEHLSLHLKVITLEKLQRTRPCEKAAPATLTTTLVSQWPSQWKAHSCIYRHVMDPVISNSRYSHTDQQCLLTHHCVFVTIKVM